MEGQELGIGTSGVRNSKEQLARKTWRNIRLQGHTYVDLRKDGKRFVYFCTICMAPCYSEPILRSHLDGNLHKRMYTAAKATLIGEKPWPFDDGVLFFTSNGDVEKDMACQGNENINLLDNHEHVNNLAVVIHNDVLKAGGNRHVNGNKDNMGDCFGDEFHSFLGNAVNELIIPNVIGLEEVSDLRVKLMGYGKISANLLEKDGVCTEMQRIWCEWLGRSGGEIDEIPSFLPLHDYAIVTFEYYYDLGRQGLFEDIEPLLLTGVEDSNDGDGSTKRRKISFSDSEDANKAPSYKSYSSGEESQGSTTTTSSALLYRRYGDQVLHSRKFIPSRKLRKKFRKEHRIASTKSCYLCKHKMLPGKDVATLMNLKTGRLVCSSRNVKGAFHVFHTSCLIHWVLLCESEMFMKPPVHPKVRGKSKRRTKSKVNQRRKKNGEGTFLGCISSVFCPDCQGTGLQIEGDELEQPAHSLSEMYHYKLRMGMSHRSWMKCPEELKNCSAGLAFPVQGDAAEEKIEYLKLLQFYRADEESRYSSC